jgi:hypothetical protein
VLEASTFYDDWPNDGKTVFSLLKFDNCTNINIQGDGVIDGLGYEWWVREWNLENKYDRPHLLEFNQVKTSEISGVKFLNSPRFHMELNDVDSINIHDLEIMVDILKQKESYTKVKETESFQDQLEDFTMNLIQFFLGEYSSVAK